MQESGLPFWRGSGGKANALDTAVLIGLDRLRFSKCATAVFSRCYTARWSALGKNRHKLCKSLRQPSVEGNKHEWETRGRTEWEPCLNEMWTNAVLMLVHRRRRRTSIKTAFVNPFLHGITPTNGSGMATAATADESVRGEGGGRGAMWGGAGGRPAEVTEEPRAGQETQQTEDLQGHLQKSVTR